MVATDVLKEYLVKLGFSIDTSAQAKIRQAIVEIEKQLDKLATNKSAKVLTHGMLAYAGAIGTVLAATGAMMAKVADADMGYQKLALRMHMTKDAAKAVTIAQKALNASLEEIAWIPELRAQYKEIKDVVQSTSPDSTALKQIRAIMFEFTKMKVIIGQGIEWIVYHLSNMFGGSLEGARKKLSDFNKWLKDNIQIWTKRIAEAIMTVVGIVKAGYEIGKKLFGLVQDFINYLPSGQAAIIAFGAAITAAFMLNPVIAGLGTLLLLLESWYVWNEGKKHGYKTYTIFGDMMEGLDAFTEKIKPALEKLKQGFGAFSFGEIFKDVDWAIIFSTIVNRIAYDINRIVEGLGIVARILIWLTDMSTMSSEWEQGQFRKKMIKKGIDPWKNKPFEEKKGSVGYYAHMTKLLAKNTAQTTAGVAGFGERNIAEFKEMKEVISQFLSGHETLSETIKRTEGELKDFVGGIGQPGAAGAPRYTVEEMNASERKKFDMMVAKFAPNTPAGVYPPIVEDKVTGMRGWHVTVNEMNIFQPLGFDDMMEQVKAMSTQKAVAGQGG